MSRIDDLISKYCPNGVELKRLGDLLDYEQPSKYIVESTDYTEVGIPVLTAGQTFILGYTDEIKGVFKASKENPVIIFDDFTTSNHWVDFDFKVKSSAIKMLKPYPDTAICFKYVFYVLNSIKYTSLEHSRKWISVFANMQIPVPPLPVQEEIVKILDSFTMLEAELEAELEARKKQYEHYRDELLDPDTMQDNVKMLPIKDIVSDSFWIMPATPEYLQEGVPYITSKNIGNGKIFFDNVKYISEEAFNSISAKRPILPNDILISMIGTLGNIAIVAKEDGKFYGQNMYLLRLNEDIVSLKYFFYFFNSLKIKNYLSSIKNNSGQGYLKTQHIEEIQIPVPPLEEQERIVSILDKFDTLVNDISEGLPAEIDARKQQYEYYRNKLLDFQQIAE